MITTEQKNRLTTWFEHLQRYACEILESIEQEFHHPHQLPGSFELRSWKRDEPASPTNDGGGGTMAVMHGNVFEKVGVNVSKVHGKFAENFAAQIPGAATDPSFWASGISFVAHPVNPFVPIAHMNTRHIATTINWFGGGADLTPVFAFDEDTKDFHDALHAVCDRHDTQDYARYKKWCDEYFFLPHRNEPRGVGGIFFDDLNTSDFEKDFEFIQEVGETFFDIYASIVRRRMHMHWTEDDKRKQLIKRARYVEFNLIYDRGTLFGLKTGANIDALFMSLPPMASWE